MPHLQEKGDDKSPSRAKLGRSFSSGSELPITEAKEGFLEATEGLLTIRSMHMAATRTTDSQGPPRTVSEDAAFTPLPHSGKQHAITPSPYGAVGHHGSRFGPVVTIYGTTKLVPSPIRVKRQNSQSNPSDDEEHHGLSHMAHATNLRHVDTYHTPTKPTLSHAVSEGFETDEVPKKRLLGQLENGEGTASKKSKLQHVDVVAKEAEVINNDATSESSDTESSPHSKNPIISPASSTEKCDDEEGAPRMQRSGVMQSYGHGFAHPPYPPRRHPFPPAYCPPPYAAGYPMYAAYPLPPPHPHFMGRPTMAPGAPPFYHPYPPPHHPAMMHHFRRTPHVHPLPGSPHNMTTPERSIPTPEAPRSSPSSLPSAEIKSVEEWQRAALTTGKPPSANRCLPLKEPIPSKYWG